MKRDELDKLRVRSNKYNFVEYLNEIREYYFYHPTEKKVFVSRHETFLENEILLERCSRSKIELDEAYDS